MAAMASQGNPSLYQDSGFMEGYSHIGKATKTPLTAKQKKVRKANKTASKSRAKNRKK